MASGNITVKVTFNNQKSIVMLSNGVLGLISLIPCEKQEDATTFIEMIRKAISDLGVRADSK